MSEFYYKNDRFYYPDEEHACKQVLGGLESNNGNTHI